MPEKLLSDELLFTNGLKVLLHARPGGHALLDFGQGQAPAPLLHFLVVPTLGFQVGRIGHQVIECPHVTHFAGCFGSDPTLRKLGAPRNGSNMLFL